jgi:hypothetical protein
MKLKIRNLSYSKEIILALKLSSSVPSKKLFYTSNSWLFRPNPKFGGQIAAVRKGIYRNPQLKVPSVTGGDVIAPPSPPLSWGWGWRLLGCKTKQKFVAKMPLVHLAFVGLTDI